MRLVDRRPRLAIPAFRRLWTASVVSAVGGSFSLVAVPTQLFAGTGSSAAVGLASAVSMASLILAALYVGALADTTDRRRLLLAGNAGLGLTYLSLWLDAVLRVDSVVVLLLLVGLQGISFGATMTTMGAAVPRVVPAGQLVAANSLSSLTRYTGAVLGPVLAGVLIPVVGLSWLYLFDALALIVVLWAVAALPPMPPERGPPLAGRTSRCSASSAMASATWPGSACWSPSSPSTWPPWCSRCRSCSTPNWRSARTAAHRAAARPSAYCSRPTRSASS